jgi:energy-coupling factor transport system permease protein
MSTGARATFRTGRPPFLDRVNPVFKLAGLLVLTVALTLFFDPVTPAAFLVLTAAGGRLFGGVRLRSVGRFLFPFAPAVAGVFLANILFNRLNATSPALWQVGSVRVTGPALVIAGSLSLRLLAFATLSMVFVRTTKPGDLVLSLVHQLRLSHRLAYGVLAGYRMLPLLSGEYALIRAAHRVRGVREAKGPAGELARARRYAVPLLAGAVRRAGRVALAMDARGFGAFPQRTYRRRMVVQSRDWVFLLSLLVVGAAVVAVLWAAGLARIGVGV